MEIKYKNKYLELIFKDSWYNPFDTLDFRQILKEISKLEGEK